MKAGAIDRPALVHRAFQLTVLTLGWNVIEGIVSLGAAAMAGSVALVGFGVDSFIESTSAGVMLWRLRAERRTSNAGEIERLDRRAHRWIGLSLFALAAFIAVEATVSLARGHRPEESLAGIVITSLSMMVMMWLARAKRATALALHSRAMAADAFQTTACWWLSLITLLGLTLNGLWGWWWADPIAALGMTWFLVSEARQALRGEAYCNDLAHDES